MSIKNIYLSEEDHNVLNHLVRKLSPKIDTVSRLRSEIERAIVIEESYIPDEAIGLNSEIEIEDIETGEVEKYTITLPAQADFEQGRLSVLTPLGTGLLGYETGDEIEWPTPGGVRRIRIRNVLRSPIETGALGRTS